MLTQPRARRSSRRSSYQADGHAAALNELTGTQIAERRRQPADHVPGARPGELGDRPVGPHPPPDRGGARASLLATEEARRGVILSLVASVASTYLQLRGLDEQLVDRQAHARRRTRESVRLFELQFKYGSGLADDRGAGADAVRDGRRARSRRSSRRSPRPRTRSRSCSAATPGRSRAASRSTTLALPARPGRRSLAAARAAARHPAGRAEARRRERPDRRRQGALLPDHLPHRRVRHREPRARQPVQRAARVWSYGGSIVGPIFTGGAISGQVAQAEAAQKAALAPTSPRSRTRSPTSTTRSSRREARRRSSRPRAGW